METVSPALRSAILDDEPIQTTGTLGGDVVLSSVVDGLWDRSLSRTTRTVYEAGFRAFERFSDLKWEIEINRRNSHLLCCTLFQFLTAKTFYHKDLLGRN